jgi:hypothetical protein
MGHIAVSRRGKQNGRYPRFDTRMPIAMAVGFLCASIAIVRSHEFAAHPPTR